MADTRDEVRKACGQRGGYLPPYTESVQPQLHASLFNRLIMPLTYDFTFGQKKVKLDSQEAEELRKEMVKEINYLNYGFCDIKGKSL